MEILFGEKNSILYLIVCLAVAAVVTFIIYFRNKDNATLSKWQLRVLYSLRFVSFSFLSVLLLSPLIKTLKRYVNNPVVILAFDNSSSIISGGDTLILKPEALDIYRNLNTGLSQKYKVVNYLFGEKVAVSGQPDFTDKTSDYSALINTIYNNHFNENVGAVVIAGDGIYNRGMNPVALARKLNFPVYTLGLGDTSVIRDSRIREIRANRTAFAGNRFPVEIDLQFVKTKNQPSELQIFKGNEMVFNRKIVPASDSYFDTEILDLPAETPGLQHYRAVLSSPVNENNSKNNTATFVIEVIESKQKVLILSEGSHPDIGAIKNTLEKQQDFEVSVITQPPYPIDFSDYQLVIFNQLPTVSNSLKELATQKSDNKTPYLFIVGSKTYIPQFNQLNAGITLTPQANLLEEARPELNKNFGLFTTSDELSEVSAEFPPVYVPFADVSAAPEFQPLFYQNIKNVATARPLVALGNNQGHKTGVIIGEGIWRWRLYNYFSNESHNQFAEWLASAVRYLALKENDDNFIVNTRTIFDETTPVILTAEVYNESFEAINTPEVTIVITGNDGAEYRFSFDKTGSGYRLDAGKLPVGDYQYEAAVTVGNETFNDKGHFTVVPVNIESTVTEANHRILYQLSAQTAGKFFAKNETGNLLETIKSNTGIKPTSYFQASLNDIINLKGIFFVFLLVLGLEWFLRKFWGIY